MSHPAGIPADAVHVGGGRIASPEGTGYYLRDHPRLELMRH